MIRRADGLGARRLARRLQHQLVLDGDVGVQSRLGARGVVRAQRRDDRPMILVGLEDPADDRVGAVAADLVAQPLQEHRQVLVARQRVDGSMERTPGL